jgi:hypothetical protein
MAIRRVTTRCVECHASFEREEGKCQVICSPDCRRQRRNRQQLAWRSRCECPQHLHGTISGYGTYGCRCDICREASTAYNRQKRAQRVATLMAAGS